MKIKKNKNFDGVYFLYIYEKVTPSSLKKLSIKIKTTAICSNRANLKELFSTTNYFLRKFTKVFYTEKKALHVLFKILTTSINLKVQKLVV